MASVELTVRYDLPMPFEGQESGEAQSLGIANSGELMFEGGQVPHSEIQGLLSRLSVEGEVELGVLAAPDASFADVAGHLSTISESNKFSMLETEKHRKFELLKDRDGRRVGPPGFVGLLGEYELPVVVGYSAEQGQCIAALDGWAQGSAELYDRSFVWLDDIVQRSGGVEAIMSSSEILNGIIARIQAEPDTPWRCVAGAVFAVQAAGWPVVQFEVTSE